MNAFPITAGCDCPGCRNYGKWATSFDTELKRILARMFELSSNYQVAFTDEIALVGEGFPTPVIQMEILAKIPWVLQEERGYYWL